jgi:enhancer of polycomb-like protein
LHLLSDDRAKRESEVNGLIQDSMNKHKIWNQSHVDNTWRPITPPLESGFRNSFREAVTEYLPTPPASSTEDNAERQRDGSRGKPTDSSVISFRYASPPIETATPGVSFRRRTGRGGRMWIDRRGPLSRKRKRFDEEDVEEEPVLEERYEYDIESDGEPECYFVNSYDSFHLQHRVEIAVASHHSAAAQQAQQQNLTAEQMRKLQEYRMRQAAAAASAGVPNGYNPATLGMAAAQRGVAVK